MGLIYLTNNLAGYKEMKSFLRRCGEVKVYDRLGQFSKSTSVLCGRYWLKFPYVLTHDLDI